MVRRGAGADDEIDVPGRDAGALKGALCRQRSHGDGRLTRTGNPSLSYACARTNPFVGGFYAPRDIAVRHDLGGNVRAPARDGGILCWHGGPFFWERWPFPAAL